MASLLSEVSSGFSTFSWGSIGQIAFAVTLVLGIILFFVTLFLFVWWKSFYIKTTIFEPYGQVELTKEEIAQAVLEAKEGKTDMLKSKKVRFDMFKKKVTHSKYVTIKGTPFFNTFMPFRRIEPVPMELMFDSGVYLLKLNKEIMIPIVKPKTIIEIDEAVTLTVADNNQWQAWNNMMADRINNKYQDTDAQKKMVMYFVIGIVAIVLVGGFLLWLIYQSVNKGYGAADKLADAANALGGVSPS